MAKKLLISMIVVVMALIGIWYISWEKTYGRKAEDMTAPLGQISNKRNR